MTEGPEEPLNPEGVEPAVETADEIPEMAVESVAGNPDQAWKMLGLVIPNVSWMNWGVIASPVRRPISTQACWWSSSESTSTPSWSKIASGGAGLWDNVVGPRSEWPAKAQDPHTRGAPRSGSPF